jgi:hypothetical protein
LVNYAVRELGSWFVIDALAKAFGGNPSGHDLRQLAAGWEACGLLEVGRKVNANGRGTTRSRRVTDELANMARTVKNGESA